MSSCCCVFPLRMYVYTITWRNGARIDQMQAFCDILYTHRGYFTPLSGRHLQAFSCILHFPSVFSSPRHRRTNWPVRYLYFGRDGPMTSKNDAGKMHAFGILLDWKKARSKVRGSHAHVSCQGCRHPQRERRRPVATPLAFTASEVSAIGLMHGAGKGQNGTR